jgi:uncharacterized membrane protein
MLPVESQSIKMSGMGVFEVVDSTVGKLALTKRGWRLAALISITLLCGAAYGVQKLVVVTVEADRQKFIDRDTNNAAAALAADHKADVVAEKAERDIDSLAARTDILEKKFIEADGKMNVIQTDVRWIRKAIEKWDRSETPTPK